MSKKSSHNQDVGRNVADVGYKTKFWPMAHVLCDSMDAAKYKHVVFGLLLLKCICDAFEELHSEFKASPVDPDGVHRAVH